MVAEIGFMKEAVLRDVQPIVLYIPDSTRTSTNGWAMLQRTFPRATLIAVDNEHVLYGETPKDLTNATSPTSSQQQPALSAQDAQAMSEAMSEKAMTK